MTENFPKLMSDTKPQIQKPQEAQRMPSRINAKRTTAKHLIFKLQKIKDKEKISKGARGEKNTLLIEEQSKNYIQLLLRNHASE